MTKPIENARALLAKLAERWDWPPPALLEEIVAIGGEIVPAIAERLTPDFFRKARTEARESGQLYYFVQILGDSGDPAAVPILFNLYGEIDEDDDLIDELPDALEKLGAEAIGPLLRLAADESLSWFPRVSAAETARNIAGNDPAQSRQVASTLREILSGYLSQPAPPDDDARDVIASVAAELASLNDLEARPLIEAAFDADLVGHRPTGQGGMDIPLIDREGVAELYAEGGRTRFRVPRPFLEYYRENYRQHQEKLESDRRLKLLEMPPALDTVVLSPRIGRNDPCWCGSGLKYKKCHLAEDEKEKSRLCLL